MKLIAWAICIWNTVNLNELVKCHWEELFTYCRFLFCSMFVLHSSVIFILYLFSLLMHLHIYLLEQPLHNVNTIKDRKFSLLFLVGFGQVFYLFVYTSNIPSLISSPSGIEPVSSHYAVGYRTVLCRNSCFAFPASLLICAILSVL